jgi:hypothetical protein
MTMPNPLPVYAQKMVDRIGRQKRFVLVDRRQCALWLVSLLLALAGVLGVAPQAIYAQWPAFDVRHPFGPINDKTYSVAVGDLNGDGHLDIVTGNHGEQNVVYLNDGTGNFATARIFGPDNDVTSSVAVGDLNSDGYLDIIIGNHGQNAVYLNDGAGNFAAARNFGPNNSVTNSVVVGDVNGDGYLDIIVGNNGQNVVYLNDGAGNFTTERNFGTGSDNTYSVVLGDLNGDSHLDIVTGNSGQIVDERHTGEPNMIYLNDGGGNFSTPRSFGTSSDRTFSVAVGDLNGDGHLDIVTGNGDEPNLEPGIFVGEQNILYLNDGTGNFSTSQAFGPNDDKTSSVVIADLDGDGYLDILVGNREQANFVYLNDGSATSFTPLVFGTGLDATRSVVAGDMNGDGHLDLVTGNVPQIDWGTSGDNTGQRLVGGQNVVYLNNGAGALSSTRDLGTDSDDTYSVAVGDVNGDGHLDIVTGNIPRRDGNNYVGGQNVVYLNDGAGHFSTARSFGTGSDSTFSVAVGDINGDGHLDIVTGNISRGDGNNYVGGQNVVYLNDGAGHFSTARNFGTSSDSTFSVAVGDMNGDGHLDIIAGNSTQQNFVYLNDGAGNFPTGRPFGTDNGITRSLVVGDMDGDGYLDIIAGDRGGQNWVYLNDGQGNFATGRPFGTGNDITQSVAVGDMDGDGYLDIVTANSRHPNIVYLNDGQGNFPTSRSFGSGNDDTNSVAVGDVDGDGHLDIITGNRGQSVVYLNDGKGHFSSSRDYGTGADYTLSVAVGDVNGDGQLDIIAGRKLSNMIFLNKMRRASGLPNHAPWLTVGRPVPTANANFFSSPVLLDSMVIPISYRLFDREGDRVGRVEAFYSPDGGGRWLPAVAAAGTIAHHLATAPGGVTHTFYWDTFASGFFGQSDNVVIRLNAYSQPSSSSPVDATYRYTNTVTGPYQWPYASATTFPFRVRGTQVRVTETTGQPAAGALVYRLPAGQVQGALPFGGARPFRTNLDGYLGGRGQMAIGDQLVALHPQSLPVTLAAQMSDVLHFYHTSATLSFSGLNAMNVSQPGVQALTVSAQTPLLLFDLNVALEWDARKDSQYLSQLEFNFKRASSLLYDWSNGQVALGQVTIYHNAPLAAAVNGWQPWQDAHIRIYATNLLRPNASKGGVITDAYTETVASGKTVTYNTGQIHMGAIWNRYGEASGNLGEDWPRALAHELAHYLLFLDDNYLGVDAQGRLITIPAEQCPGAMNNPYSDLHSEFHPQLDWLPGCQQTLSHQELGRSDWATIIAHYPMLKAPAGSFAQTSSAPAATAGPNLLPLAVTQVQFRSPVTPAQALDAPFFSLIQPGSGAVASGNGTRAYLYPANSQRIVDLGQPSLDQVLAQGARPGDRLCVYDPAAQRQGCTIIQAGIDQLLLQQMPQWQPDVRLSPVISTTLQISVTTAMDGVIQARLYPVDAPAPATIALSKVNGVYTGNFVLNEAALDGHLQVIAQIEGQEVEVVTAYSLGGNPVRHPSRPVRYRSRAPAISADGQVIVYGEQFDSKQDEEWIFTVQTASTVPDTPPWATLVGQGYWLLATPNAPNLQGATISFYYLGDSVPAGEERFLRIYYREEKQAALCPFASQQLPCWRPLETTLDTFYNFAAAELQGPGLYALMSSIELPLTGARWNLFAYPVRGSRPVNEALHSIYGAYSVVWGYDSNAATEADAWRFYAPGAPAWANDLTSLQFGKGYWLYVTAPGQVSLYLKGNGGENTARNASVLGPPAVYYGTLSLSATLTPVAGMMLTAGVDGHICGTAQTKAVGNQIVYVIKVAAEDGATYTGCGAAGRTVTLRVEGASLQWSAMWDNSVVAQVDSSNPTGDSRLFLPLVTH